MTDPSITVLTAALVLITGIYAYLTYRLAKASEHSVDLVRKQLDAITRPYITISLVKPHNNPFIYLKLENTGKTPANNVLLTLGPEFQTITDHALLKSLCDSYIFTKKLTSFPPCSPILFTIGSGHSLLSTFNPQKAFSIKAKYAYGDNETEEISWIDVNQYDATAMDTDPIVSSLDSIRKVIESHK